MSKRLLLPNSSNAKLLLRGFTTTPKAQLVVLAAAADNNRRSSSFQRDRNYFSTSRLTAQNQQPHQFTAKSKSHLTTPTTTAINNNTDSDKSSSPSSSSSASRYSEWTASLQPPSTPSPATPNPSKKAPLATTTPQQQNGSGGGLGGSGSGGSNSGKSRSRSSQSDARERSAAIRYYYTDPEIDRYAEKPLIRINPMTMMYMAVTNDLGHLLHSANYLRQELPIRLAHMIKVMRMLPFIVACNPSMLDIHERCIRAFRNVAAFDKEIKDIKTQRRFNQLIVDMLDMNKELLTLLCDGFKDTRRFIKNEEFIKSNLNRILSARLGVRLLCEHHIALNRQANIDPLLTVEEEEKLKQQQKPGESTTSSSCQEEDDDETKSGQKKGDDWVGIIHKKFSPKKMFETSTRLVTRICLDTYGISPKVKIDGHVNATFPYMPLPLEYIVPELLKNAFRATCEHHRGSPQLPDVTVTIAINDRDCVMRIRDRGGGVSHSLVNKIFDYHFSTEERTKPAVSKHGLCDSKLFAGGGVEKDQAYLDGMSANTGVGMLCEASSKGLAIMHGYGFGLPTSRAYAEYLGGSLTLQSMQGIGSDFYLRIALFDSEFADETVRI